MVEQFMLTTTDNPFSPLTEWDEWLTWDMQYYNSMSLLARVVVSSDDLPPALQAQAIQDGIEEIVRENLSGVHTRVRVPSEEVSQQESGSDADLSENRAA